jgi:hypothetical protein
MKVAKAMIREPRGSESRVKRESEVNTLAVSKVAPLPLFFARMVKTAKVRIGAMTGVENAGDLSQHDH